MAKRLVALLVIGLFGCTGSAGGVVESDGGSDAVAPDDTQISDGGEQSDLAVKDVHGTKETFDFGPAPDEVEEPLCEAGEGCFLDPCAENSDCQSGYCVEHMGDDVCTIQCAEECPPGWSCQQIGGGPDMTFVCVSHVANLCKPCGQGADCKSPGGADDVCVDYGSEGSFCGAACVAADDCPWGFSCKESTTVDGLEVKQCLADAGVCPCSSKSVDLALWTPCEVGNEFGTCQGKRVCTEDGLSECDAADAQQETCNGLDDNCDGAVDLDTDSGQTGDAMCEDENPCTVDTCDGENGCQYEVLNEGECLDGDACTIGDHCESGVCVGMPIQCDDSDPCTDDFCDGLGGCSHEFNEVPCDDDDPCTVADRCDAGECLGVQVPCDCMQTADCGALEDGNLCNGLLVCDTGEWPYQCKIDEETVVTCPEPEGLDAPCLAAACDPVSGACSLVAAHEGAACNDGDPCTLADTCVEGVCTGGPTPICKDDNPCTDDACEAGVGCVFVPNSLPCNDGDVCTTADVCTDGECVGGAALLCDDENACNGVETCDSQVGCVAGTPLACDDGKACNGPETCQPDVGCVPGLAPVCDDGDKCNGSESCSDELGCVAGEPLVCDDGDACNGQESCDSGLGCVPGPPPVCNDGNVCTDDGCDAKTGCVFTFNEAGCDDGNACTVGDKCAAGKCVSSGLVNCDDDSPCTNDSCDPANGCLHLLNTAPCNDGNVCTLNDTCDLGECKGTSDLVCNDGNVCTTDACDPDVGCQFTPTEDACDDGNACTSDDQCVNGFCSGLSTVQCNDDNPCTLDTCSPQEGCLFTNIEGPCSDGDACTVGDVCVEGACVAGDAAVCDDGNVCTLDGCDSQSGCTFTPQDGECDDGNACTENDVCVDAACGGEPVVCDDGIACTTDSCDEETGCVYEPIVPCCGNGDVEEGEVCDDGNTVDGDGCEGDCLSVTPLTVTFTTCGKTGRTGPGQGECDAVYAGTVGLEGKVTLSGGIQFWTVPYSGTYRITAAGAKTLGGTASGGYGAVIRGDVDLVAGTQLKILIGQTGTDNQGVGYQGGSGGSFVATAANDPVLVAGGGGGHDTRYGLCSGVHGQAGQNGASPCYCQSSPVAGGVNGQAGQTSSGGGGGGGFYSSATDQGGQGFVQGGLGGSGTYGDGGFGGGGGTGDDQGGSGGGYSGGGGCGDDGHGGGGGSYNSGANQSNQAGANNGQGYVIIELL